MRRPRLTTDQYIALGKEAILDLLRTEHAATWAEIQAKIADRPWREDLPRVDPHHLTTARRELAAEKRVTETFDTYRGHEIGVLHLADLSRRKTAFASAAARKRRLAARLLAWARSTPQHPGGLIGTAGEAVVHASLRAAAPHGYRLVRPEGGDVRRLFGHEVPGGPLDNAAFLQLLDDVAQPLPLLVVAVEVKNVRHWLYPNAQEIYQLLYKAARLRELSGEMDVLPILVCRRRAYLTYEFARALGFIAFETLRQYVLPGTIASAKLDEVRKELGFADLTASADADSSLLRLFEDTVPRLGPSIAARWAEGGARLVKYYDILRGHLSERDRQLAMDDLRDAMDESGLVVQW